MCMPIPRGCWVSLLLTSAIVYLSYRTLQYVQACISLGNEVSGNNDITYFNTSTLTMLSVPATHTNGSSQLGVAVVDAWKAMEGPSDNRGDYLSDGLHLNARYLSPRTMWCGCVRLSCVVVA
jgi:hypothetical protein